MTEKRFNKHIPDSCYTSCVIILDNHTDKGFADIDDIVDLLNELHNKYIDEYTLRETLQLELQRVEEENKELKAQLYCDDESVCNICKHQQLIPHKVMQGYYTAKCEKGYLQCSTSSVRYCKDFKFKELQE
jgi:hypothetical protein